MSYKLMHFWLFKASELTSFKLMQMSFPLFSVSKDSNDVSSSNLKTRKTMKTKFFSKIIH